MAGLKPDEVAKETEEQKIERIDALTDAGRVNWFGLLAYLVFAYVTVLSVGDADFFIRSQKTQVPLVNISIPTASFFVFSPVLGLALYVYLHLHVRKVSEALVAPKPASNGISLERRIKPWLLNDLILRRHDRRAIDQRALDRFADWVTITLIWIAGPFVLGSIWTNTFVFHSFWLTLLSGLCFMSSIVVGCITWQKMEQDTDSERKVASADRQEMLYRALPLTLLIIGYGYLATKGLPRGPHQDLIITVYESLDDQLEAISDDSFDLPDQTPRWLRARLFAAAPKLAEAQFSVLPPDQNDPNVSRVKYRADWCKRVGHPPLVCGRLPSKGTETPSFQLDERLSWCKERAQPLVTARCREYFETADVEFTQKWKGFRDAQVEALVKPDMRNRDLRNADLRAAALTGIDFQKAQLDGANLTHAQMERVNLTDATLNGADLNFAELQFAEFREARLEGANLSGARLDNATLILSNLRGILGIRAQFENATLSLTDMSGSDLSSSEFVNSALFQTDFQDANLRWVEFSNSGMLGTNFENSTLSFSLISFNQDEGEFNGVDMRGAVNDGGALRNLDMRGITTDEKTDFRNAFLDASVFVTPEFEDRMGTPCQWVWAREANNGAPLEDETFFAMWRGWAEKKPDRDVTRRFADMWQFNAPRGLADIVPIAPPEGCSWATGDLSDAQTDGSN